MTGLLLDHPIIGRRMFFPRRCWLPAPFIVEAGDATLGCSFHPADPGGLTVVHFHGNGEVVGDYLGGFSERFAALDCGLLLAEYRGYGMSSGEPRLGKMLDDVEHVVRAAGVPPRQLVAFGRSIGSIFALEAVSRFPEIAGLVIESGIADPLERLLVRVDPADVGASPEELAAAVAERLDHRKKMAAYRGPVLVMHTLFDDLVDVTHAERLASWAGGQVTLKLFDRGHHNTIMTDNESAYFAAVGELLRACEAP